MSIQSSVKWDSLSIFNHHVSCSIEAGRKVVGFTSSSLLSLLPTHHHQRLPLLQELTAFTDTFFYSYITSIIIQMICIKTHYFKEIDLKKPKPNQPSSVFCLNLQIIFVLWFGLQGAGGVEMVQKWGISEKRKGWNLLDEQVSIWKMNVSKKIKPNKTTQHLRSSLCHLLRQIYHLK